MPHLSLNHRLELLLAISLVLSFFPWGKRILFPFQLFTTWIHECCHGIMAILMGGSVLRVTIESDGSGLTHYKIPSGRLRQAMVASSGYLGSSMIGCALFYLSVRSNSAAQLLSSRILVFSLCGLIGLSLLFWIRNVFGFVSTLTLGVALGLMNYTPASRYASDVLDFIAIQTALNALFDIRTLFGLGTSKGITSDAHTMQKLFWFPHWLWAFSWLCLSAFMMYWTVIKTIS
jgi:hypothetical protein